MPASCSQIGIERLVAACGPRLAQVADVPHLAQHVGAPSLDRLFDRRKAFLRPRVSCLRIYAGSGCECSFSPGY